MYDSFRRVKEVNRHPVAANPADPCQSLYMYYDYPVITDQGVGTYTWGRLSGVEWGDPTACPGGLMTEGYNYSVSGLVLTKRLQVEKFLSAGYPNSVGMLTAYWTYDNEGRMTQEWYPDDGTIFQYNAPVYTYTFDGMKRPVKLTSAGVDWAKDVVYGPASEMTEMKFLLPGGGYYTEARTYNERLQLRKLIATGAGAPSVNLEYRYSLTQNNGQITQMKDWISGEEVTYQYDLLSRLTSAVTTGPEWGLSFTYDGFGNKTQQTVTKGSGPPFSAAVDGLTNRFVGAGYSYDANGNLTSMGTYDVANRLQGSGNVYGPRNERIMKGGSGEVNFYSPDGRRMGAYQMIVSYGVIGFNQIRTNVYFAGKLIREANEAVVLDRLGSVRVRGSQVMNYYPYGEERTTTANNYTKFGTYFRDEPGLDYADQRYYSNVQGRFLTADPYVASANGANNPADPVTWNRYSYLGGDPINRIDPKGLFWEGPHLMAPDGSIMWTPNVGGGYGLFVASTVQHGQEGPIFDPIGDLPLARAFGGFGAGSSSPDPCDEHKTAINDTIAGSGMPHGKSLQTRVVENLFGDPSKWDGHMEQIQSYRNRLRTLFNKLKRDNCPDPPPSVLQWYEQTSPENLEKCDNKLKQRVE